MYRYAFLLGLFFSIAQGLKAQILEPAIWSHSSSATEVKVGDEVDLIFTATIDPDWYLYSSDFDPDLGPMVTEFEFLAHPSYELVDGIKPIGAKEGYDEIFDGKYTYFKSTGEFRQKIKVISWPPKIEGSYSYQVCSDVSGLCIPGDGEFMFDQFAKVGSTSIPEKTSTVVKPEIEPVKSEDENEDVIALKPLELDKSLEQVAPVKADKSSEDPSSLNQPKDNQSYSIWWFMVIAFLGGLTALMTPCVYPLIPMTVAFFSQDRNPFPKALFYGFSIVAIY
ncbi:MAG: protein-disulfide reductase DsbD domain-containing protein, partial [Cyclobacteriaceae bacterium]